MHPNSGGGRNGGGGGMGRGMGRGRGGIGRDRDLIGQTIKIIQVNNNRCFYRTF